MESGAGSVGDSACPALPKTVSTSGIFFQLSILYLENFVVSLIDIPGTAVA